MKKNKSIDKKQTDTKVPSFHPIISIVIGFIITYIILNIILNYTFSKDLDSMALIITIANVGSLLIGGFFATFFTKEKKIRYGIYLGIIWVISIGGLIPNLFLGHPTSLSNIINTILRYIIFIIAPMTGSYLSILIAKHQKR